MSIMQYLGYLLVAVMALGVGLVVWRLLVLAWIMDLLGCLIVSLVVFPLLGYGAYRLIAWLF